MSLLGLITDVDLRSHENNLAHRTREIDRERLIVRRGQPFSISVQCYVSLPPKHQLELILHLGEYSLIWILGDYNKYVFSIYTNQNRQMLTISCNNAITQRNTLQVLVKQIC